MNTAKKLLFVLVVTMTACAGSSKKETAAPVENAAPSDKPLFERLGGLDAISAVVDQFLANVVADARINARFANADAKHLRQMLIDQICDATGGGPIVGCKYTGKTMVEVHTGMQITDDEFNALVDDLVKALDQLKVPAKEKGELLSALGGMKPDVVGK
jgi:hemoglobin